MAKSPNSQDALMESYRVTGEVRNSDKLLDVTHPDILEALGITLSGESVIAPGEPYIETTAMADLAWLTENGLNHTKELSPNV